MKKRKIDIYNIFGFSLLILITILSCVRFNYLPQFIDDYYHLSVAFGFIKSGGWTGIDWWNFSPYGRPHLYPPLYHFVIVSLISMGIDGITALRITEILIVPLFFFLLWYIFKKQISSFFSFFFLIISSSFFAFYSSVSGNIPASLAVIFGVLCWYFLKEGKIISSILFLALSFYTHAGIPWIFVISLLILGIFSKEWRKKSLLIISASIVLASPFIIHQLHYLSYVHLTVLREVRFSHYSILILLAGLFSLLYCLKIRGFFSFLFLGYTLGSIVVFFKYPYRFFSAQGMLGLCMGIAYILGYFRKNLSSKKEFLITLILGLFFFFIHPTVDLKNGKLKYNFLNSTYYNFISGKFVHMFEFNTLFYPKYYTPIVEVIKKYTNANDIIASNIPVASQIFSALSNRPTSSSIMVEVESFKRVSPYRLAKIIVWIRPEYKELNYWIKRFNLIKLYDNELGIVLLNPHYSGNFTPLKAKISFKIVNLCSLFFLFIFLLDNVKILGKNRVVLFRKEDV